LEREAVNDSDVGSQRPDGDFVYNPICPFGDNDNGEGVVEGVGEFNGSGKQSKARSVGPMSFILICRVQAKVVSNFELMRLLIDGEQKGCDCTITLSYKSTRSVDSDNSPLMPKDDRVKGMGWSIVK
jgi:hypothetical protein